MIHVKITVTWLLIKHVIIIYNLYQEITFGTKKKWSFMTGDLLKEVKCENFYDGTGKR